MSRLASLGDSAIDIFLQPGDYFVGDGAFRVATVLGSCVSVTLWHRASRIGAMSHCLLPAAPAGRAASHPPDPRYGADALALMLEALDRLGVRGTDCEAKVFGGARMFAQRRGGQCSIGQQNGEAARALLAAQGIPVLRADLFGCGHRQVVFDIASGDVWARQLPLAAPAASQVRAA